MTPAPYYKENRFTKELIEDVKRRRRTIAGRIAVEFSKLLREELSPADIEAVICRNMLERDDMVCHSHDFTDANEVMIEAFVNAGMDVPDPQHDETCLMWDYAWAIAKKAKFNPGEIKLYFELKG